MAGSGFNIDINIYFFLLVHKLPFRIIYQKKEEEEEEISKKKLNERQKQMHNFILLTTHFYYHFSYLNVFVYFLF